MPSSCLSHDAVAHDEHADGLDLGDERPEERIGLGLGADVGLEVEGGSDVLGDDGDIGADRKSADELDGLLVTLAPVLSVPVLLAKEVSDDVSEVERQIGRRRVAPGVGERDVVLGWFLEEQVPERDTPLLGELLGLAERRGRFGRRATAGSSSRPS